jgi:trans-aconitate methyltransferase
VDSFDWDRHWIREEEPRDAKAFAETMAQRIIGFMDGKNIESMADFGCGPASMLFVLAEECPGVQLHGYDASGSIIKRNEAKTRELGLKNLSFTRDELPSPSSLRRHDMVTCFSTLHYIREIREAIKALYGAVNDGGWLIFNYPSMLTRNQMRREIAPDDDSLNRRFRLVLAGENLLTMNQIEELLGVRPGKFYSSKRYNIYVKIRKSVNT